MSNIDKCVYREMTYERNPPLAREQKSCPYQKILTFIVRSTLAIYSTYENAQRDVGLASSQYINVRILMSQGPRAPHNVVISFTQLTRPAPFLVHQIL